MQPYVGVTGFTRSEEVQAALDAWPKNNIRKLMVGVLASSTTLEGRTHKGFRRSRHPLIEDIGKLFFDDPRACNIVHYHTEAKVGSTLLRELIRVKEFAGPHIHGFQLNVPWPEWSVPDVLHTMYPLTFVLQIGTDALVQAGYNPEKVRARLKPYLRAIDYVIIDISGGKGVPLKADFLRPILRAIKPLGVGLVVAGGLGPETLGLVEPLLAEFPNLSIDAEGLLRIPGQGLDLERVRSYLTAAHELFSKPG